MATGSGSLQAQSSTVFGVSENKIVAGAATVGALVPEPNGTTVTYDGNTNLILSAIHSSLNGTYAYLPNDGFTISHSGNNVIATANDDYAVFYNDDEANPRAVVFRSEHGHTQWVVQVFTSSATTWTGGATIGANNALSKKLNVNSVSAERPESGESSSTEEIYTGPSYVTGTAERTVTASGTLQAQASSTSGTSERKIDPVDVNLVAGEVSLAEVTGNVERQVDAELTTVDSQVSSTAGVSERVVVVANGDLTAEEVGVAIVGGSVERQIDGELTSVDAQVSSAGGVAERTVEVILSAESASVSSTDGVAERTVEVVIASENASVSAIGGFGERLVRGILEDIDFDGTAGEIEAQDATVAATVEITSNGSGTPQAQDATVAGVAENSIVGSGTLADGSSSVSGTSEREITSSGTLADGASSASGVSEREVATSTGNVNVDLSSVSATGTVGRHASGTPQAQASSVSSTVEIVSNGSGSLSDSSSQVTGASEREVTSTGALSDGSSTVTGITEREVVSVEADLSSDEIGVSAVAGVAERAVVPASGISQISASTVSGVSERQVDATGALQDQASEVTGVAENTVNASGTLTDGDSTVSGVSERSITGSGTLTDGSSSVAGIAENEVVAGSVALTIGLSSVSATVEITSNGSGVLADDAVTVAGVAERQIDATGANDTETVTLSGVAERQIDVTGAMDTDESSVTAVTEITSNGTGTPQAQSSITVGVSERTINGSGTLVSQEETVDGLVERVVLPDNITLQCLTTPSEVTGVAERIVEDDIGAGTDHDVNASDVQVSGVSERIITVDESDVAAGQSTVVSVSEREVETNETVQALQAGSSTTGIADGLPHNAVPGATIRKTGDQAQPSEVAGVAERIITVDAGIGVATEDQYAPEENEYLSYSGDNVVVSGLSAAFNGTYTLASVNFKASWQSGYKYVADSQYRVYQKQNSGSDYDIIIWNTLLEQWHIFEESTSVESASAGDSLFDGSTTGIAEELVTIAGSPGNSATDSLLTAQANVGYLSREDALNPGTTVEAQASVVAGVSEREVETNELDQELTVSDVTLAGIAERIITVDAGIDLPDDVSKVTGLAEREVVTQSGVEQAQSSATTGVAERIVENNNITLQVIAQQSSVDAQANITYESREDALNLGSTLETVASSIEGTSERELRSGAALRPTTENLVTGLSERSIVGVNTALTADEVGVSAGVGVAERTVVTSDGTTEADPSQIVGVAERSITGSGTLVSSDATSTGEVEGIKTGDGVLTTGSVTVAGVAERIVKLPVVGSGDLTADEVGVAAVTGVGERIVVEADGTPQSQASVVDGLSERTIVGVNTDLVAGEISVVSIDGEAEREVFQLLPPGESEGWKPTENNLVTGLGEVKKVGSGDLQTTSSVVSSVSERIIEQEGGGELQPTENNVVTGVAEKKITGSGVLDGLSDHIVVGSSERIVTGEGVLETEENLVTGLAERIVVLEDGMDMPDDDAAVVGVAERKITSSGDLVPTDNNEVVGVAERIITVDAGIEQTDESVVSGTVERIITVDAGIDMPDDDSKVVATAERIITVDAGIDMPDDDSKVTGISERTITVDEGIEQGDVSKVVSDAERIIPSETGAPRAVLSYVSGVAERTVNLFSGIEQVQESTVNGLAERKIDQEGGGVFKPTDNNVIAGVAERIITVDAGIDMPDDDSKVTGTSERVVVLQDGIRHFHDATVSGEGIRASVIVRDAVEADESTVAGIAERTIVQEGDAEFKPTDNNLVEGTAEREIRTSADLVTDGNRVIGTSERISVSIFSDLQAGSSVVTQDPDPITIVRHPIGGLEYPEYRSDLEAFSSHTLTVSERKIVQETDGLSTELKFAPNPSDPNVVYPNDSKTLVLQGNADPANDGVYDLLGEGYTVAVYLGTSLIVTENKNYNVYYRKVGYKDYRLVMFRTTNLTWVAFQTSINPELDIYTDLIYSGAQSSAELIASTSASRGGPYKIMKPTDYNVVSGTAERLIDQNNLNLRLDTDESEVTGVATRVLRPITGATADTQSIVTGIGERLLNNDGLGQQVYTGPSTVQGSGDRHSVATGALVTGESTVTGEAENSIDFISGVEQVDDAVVSGSGARTANVLDGIERRDNIVSGVAERQVDGSGASQAQSSTVNGLGVRTSITEDATLQAGYVQVVATDDRTIIGVPGKVDPKASDSTVTATTKRTVNISGDVQAPDHIVDAEIERKISGSGSEQTKDHIVDGVAERVITAVGVLEADECSVTGEANKAMHVVQGIAQVSSSVVHGVAERSITISADLVSTDSKVDARVYTNNIEQQAMHVQIKFRIRKEPVRRIIVRQTPTNRV